MLRSLFPQVKWDNVQIVGFDLDGTLYDEIEFIVQVYRPISRILANFCDTEPEPLFNWMLLRWLEKGSSYNSLFSDVITNHGIDRNGAASVVSECVSVFRNYKPILKLPDRVSTILDLIKEQYECFLLTDGTASLQFAKIKALGLHRWFSSENIGISGVYGPDFAKPSLKMIEKISVLQRCACPLKVVYFGDRIIDKQFADATGFQFVHVNVLFPGNFG